MRRAATCALHPYAMAWYDRLRSEGAGAFDAMRQALPMFGRARDARPGDSTAHRRALESGAGSRDGDVMQSEQVAAVGRDQLAAATVSAHAPGDRTAAQLATECFPCTAADAVAAAASPARRAVERDVSQLGPFRLTLDRSGIVSTMARLRSGLASMRLVRRSVGGSAARPA